MVHELVAITTVVVDGQWRETRERYRFLALFDEADYLRISSSLPGKAVARPPFTVKTRRIGESWSHDFYHQGPMRRDQIYDLRLQLVPGPEPLPRPVRRRIWRQIRRWTARCCLAQMVQGLVVLAMQRLVPLLAVAPPATAALAPVSMPAASARQAEPSTSAP